MIIFLEMHLCQKCFVPVWYGSALFAQICVCANAYEYGTRIIIFQLGPNVTHKIWILLIAILKYTQSYTGTDYFIWITPNEFRNYFGMRLKSECPNHPAVRIKPSLFVARLQSNHWLSQRERTRMRKLIWAFVARICNQDIFFFPSWVTYVNGEDQVRYVSLHKHDYEIYTPTSWL